MLKLIDFHLSLALVAVVAVSGAVFLQFVEADAEFETLNGLSYSIVRSRDSIDNAEISVLNNELDQLEKELEMLDLELGAE